MPEPSFDIHQYIKRLQDVGVPEEQGEVHVSMLRDVIEHRLVTREYLDYRLQELEHRLENRIDEVEQGLRKRIDDVEHRFGERMDGLERRMDKVEHEMRELGHRLTIRLGGMIVAGVVVLGVLITVLELVTG